MRPARATGPPGRVAWLDLARAVSILLVVLYHVGVTAGPDLLRSGTTAATLWTNLNLALVPLRMPLFFLVAGVLAVRAVHRPWPRVIRPRILDLLWPYVVWSLLFAVTGWPRYAPEDPVGFLGEEIAGMAMIGSPYWFIAVLPIFFLVARLGRDRRVVLVGAALVAYAAAPFIQQIMHGTEAPADLVYGVFQLTDNALWFMLGVTLHRYILEAGEQMRAPSGAAWGTALATAFCLLTYLVQNLDAPVAALRILEFGASLTGLSACIALLPLVARWGRAAVIGAHLGSRTLVIYLVHPIVLNAVVILWRSTDTAGRLDSVDRSILLVPVITLLAVAVALLVDAVIGRWGPRWLLRFPGGREKSNTGQARRRSS